MEQPQRASLKDVINYKPEEYLSKDDIVWIQNVFRDGRGVQILRKLFVPTITDPELPIEQMGNDFFIAGRVWAQIPAEEAKIMMCAREDALQFIMGGLIKLKVLANQPVESPVKLGKDKDSNQ